jgi:hypothetical protein
MPLPKICVVCRNILAEEGEEGLQEDTRYQDESDFPSGTHVCVVCARKERVLDKIKEYTPFMKKFSDLVNRAGFDFDGIVSDALVTCFFQQHRYLQQEMIIGLIKMFGKIGEQSGSVMYEDARNQWALKWCKQVSKMDVQS